MSNTYQFSQIVLFFTFYSIAGWICETIYVSIGKRKLVSRGFMYGPYCPIYGFGGVIIMEATKSFLKWPWLVFLVAMLSAAILEYFTSWAMEKLFNMRWWDYSEQKYNLNGRICLKNLLLFGIMALFMSYLLNPAIENVISKITPEWQHMLANILVGMFIIDSVFTVEKLIKVSKRIQDTQADIKKIIDLEKTYNWFDTRDLTGSYKRLREVCAQHPESDECISIIAFLDDLNKFQPLHRMMEAYSKMRITKLPQKIENLLSEEIHYQEIKEKLGLRKGKIKKAQESWHQAVKENFNYNNLFWIFTIASILGYIVEMIFCVITRGEIQSRQGLLYGPFSQIYGIGAVIMVLVLLPLARKNNAWIFFGGAILGGGFEVLCSLFQHHFFGTVSWDYSRQDFGILGGRTSLSMMLLWGMLSLFFIKIVYPIMKKGISKIPQTAHHALTIIFTLLIAVDIVLSCVAVYRWTERDQGQPATNSIEEFMDVHYPDDFMKKVYPNMKDK